MTSRRRAGPAQRPPSHRRWDWAHCATARRGGLSAAPEASRGLRHPSFGGRRRARRRGPGSGDGVRSGSLAGIGIWPIWGSPERAELEEGWSYLRRSGRLRSEPGTVEVSHRYSQRRHFAQAGESECLPGGGAKVPRPIVVGNVCGSALIDRSSGQSNGRLNPEDGSRAVLR